MTCSTSNTDCPLQISKSALSTLESIHRAGILHGDIRRENILIGDSGITIIDFGHSKQCHDQGAKDEELACLRHFLGLARKNH
jgi:serine/threonine protein kinase